ncbi:MAG: hypothetical protein KGH54_00480 [Candidatus Micrarchaeota archaeon]|nr:hypothetical protein [Candidatus Micrarchaeota archaeon]
MPSLIPVLKGKDARDFEAYIKRPATLEELKYFRECDDFYSKHRVSGDEETADEKKTRLDRRRELTRQIRKLERE